MIETLKYIGRWFIRFILIAIIFSTFQSCAKAVTYADLSEYVNATADLYPDNVHYQIFRNKVNSADFANDYPTVALSYDNVTISRENLNYQTITLKFYNATSYNINKTEMRFTGTQTMFNFNYSWSGNGSSTPITNSPFAARAWSTTAEDYNNLRGMDYNIDDLSSFDLPLTYVGNQALQPQVEYLQFINTIEYGAYNGSLYTYYYQGDFYSNNEIKLGDVLPNDSYYFEIRLKESNTEVIKGTSYVALNTSPYTFYNDGAIYINENYEVYTIPRLLNYNTQYQLEIISYYGDGNNNLYEDIDWFIFLPENATISGDIITSLGSGDFTTKDSTNQIIENNNSFFENLYNQMFTVSGEQVQQIVNTTMEHIQIPSGEIAEIEQIFNYLSGDAGDFVISWTDKTTHFTVNGADIHQLTIPSKQINFSEMERQSPELQQAMHWARLITNISIFSILIHEAYICLLATLGIPVAIYGQKLEEKAQLQAQQQKQEQAWQNRLEQQRYNDWLYSHRKR